MLSQELLLELKNILNVDGLTFDEKEIEFIGNNLISYFEILYRNNGDER